MSKKQLEMTWKELSEKYCGRQMSTPTMLHTRLSEQLKTYQPKGWMLLECQMLDSSRLGQLVIIPYGGPANTFAEPPDFPISPRGLASDMSVVVGILLVENFPSQI